MRGARALRATQSARPRIIPAYAGSTPRYGCKHDGPADHPRVCGEHIELSDGYRAFAGSSPRMRGAQNLIVILLVRFGIIPAYAGSTARQRGSRQARWDHPRVCGEHVTKETMSNCELGSSPRMRGAPVEDVPVRKLGGIIPAYAGSTAVRKLSPLVERDHPRVCGEHFRHCRKFRLERGSSPRMRGAPNLAGNIISSAGIIPAYAGSTRPQPHRRSSRKDHPRVCGEHGRQSYEDFVDKGSSPRMRGAPVDTPALLNVRRIIPAYAGSTTCGRTCPWPSRDHPRVCGEHRISSLRVCVRQGSSPRMRGAHAGDVVS